ncbi:MAG TPA: alanine racemase [Chloroflexota bacterium]|nr:alanine racemase [Chloroflexota bacterium]
MCAVWYLDPSQAVAAYRALVALPAAPRPRYAVKANAHPALLAALAAAGAHFAVVGEAELAALRVLGVPGARIACVTPGPPATLLRACRAAGVGWYAVDSPWEVRKLGALVPGAAALVVLALPPAGRLRYPTVRIGAGLADLDALLAAARAAPVELIGVQLHVGSQCERLAAWRRGVVLAALAWQRLCTAGWRPRVLNLGGGLPVSYRRPVPTPAAIARAIERAVARVFPVPPAELWWEPGRYIAAGAGVLAATVTRCEEGPRVVVQLDVGRYRGLPEAARGIRYAYLADGTGTPRPTVVAGPLGPRYDLLARRAWLPRLRAGERVWLPLAGAYTIVQTAYPATADVPVVLGPLPPLPAAR